MLFKKPIDALNLEIKENYYIMGDWFCTNVMITALPNNFPLGLLSFYNRDPNIRLSMTSYPLTRDLTKDLKNQYNKLEEDWGKEKDPTAKQRMQNELEKLDRYIKEQSNSNDRTFNITLIFTIRSDNLDDMRDSVKSFKERLKHDGFKVASPSLLKTSLIKASTPLWMDHGIQKDVYYGLDVPLQATSVAGLYPYIFSQLKDEKGFTYGSEFQSGGIINWDPMFYKNNVKEAVPFNRFAGTMVVVGKSGMGKTTDISLIIMWAIREGLQLCWIDPENKNERLCKVFGGQYIAWGTRQATINVFDLKKLSFDEDDESEVDPWDTEQAIYNAIDDFKTILALYKKDISEDTLSVIGELMIEMYRRKGITFETPFRYLSPEDYPTLSNFNTLLQERIVQLKGSGEDKMLDIYLDLSIKIMPMINEHKYFFDGITTVNLAEGQQNMLCFGTKALIGKPQGLKDALNFLMFRYAWTICLDESKYSAFVIDEAHEFILEGRSAEQIALFYRRSRKYNNLTCLGTQETRDFASPSVYIHAKAIFNNSTYKIIKGLDKDAVEFLKQLMDLNEQESDFVKTAVRGSSLFVCGNQRYTCNVFATEQELNWIDASRGFTV